MTRTELFDRIHAFTTDLETDPSADVCLCQWVTMDTAFGERKVKSHVDMRCPVHTKEGLIFAFVTTVLYPEEYAENAKADQPGTTAVS
jgi:hypothetical protein